MISWRSLAPVLPIATVSGRKITGVVLHRQGRYGTCTGNWVSGDPEGETNHWGWDVIGWLSGSELHTLGKNVICCSPIDGVVGWTGADEHGYPSINMRHSQRTLDRRRFSFFGDLEEVFVKAGQSVSAGTPLGRPAVFKQKCRFFHFAMGYEIRRNGKFQDVFIDPGPPLRAKIAVRPALPW